MNLAAAFTSILEAARGHGVSGGDPVWRIDGTSKRIRRFKEALLLGRPRRRYDDDSAIPISDSLERKGRPIMTTGTVRLHRVLRAPPERIYRAFLDPDAMVKWLPPHGFTGKVHHLEARPGGKFRMSFTNLSTGHAHSFGGEYLELVPSERISHTDRFDDPNLPDEMRTTVSLKKVAVGTELSIVQEGIPGVIPVEACYLGWQESLSLLTLLVEAQIPE